MLCRLRGRACALHALQRWPCSRRGTPRSASALSAPAACKPWYALFTAVGARCRDLAADSTKFVCMLHAKQGKLAAKR